jgi:hypothetical protein
MKWNYKNPKNVILVPFLKKNLLKTLNLNLLSRKNKNILFHFHFKINN